MVLERFKHNHMYFVNQGKTEMGQDCLYFCGKTERDEMVIAEFQINLTGGCTLQVKSNTPHLVGLT